MADTNIQLTPEQNRQLQEAQKRAADSTNMLNESSQELTQIGRASCRERV